MIGLGDSGKRLIRDGIIVFFVANSILKFGTIGLNNKNIARLPLISLYASILISIPEEILFRGLIQTYLYSISYDVILPLLISSLIFGLSHILNGAKGISPSKWNGKLVVMTFLAGIFLGYSFYITGSLVVPIVLHTVFILIIKVFIKDEVKV